MPLTRYIDLDEVLEQENVIVEKKKTKMWVKTCCKNYYF